MCISLFLFWGEIVVKRVEPFDWGIEQVKPSRGWNPLTEVVKQLEF